MERYLFDTVLCNLCWNRGEWAPVNFPEFYLNWSSKGRKNFLQLKQESLICKTTFSDAILIKFYHIKSIDQSNKQTNKQPLFVYPELKNSEQDISVWNPRESSWMGEGGARGLETLHSGFQLILIMFILELVVFPGWSLWTTRWFSVSF